MILTAILCVQHFCSSGAMLFIVNLLIKTDSTVICVTRMLEHVCYEPFSLKKLQIWKNLIELVEFCVLSKIHTSKTCFKQINENVRLKVYALMFWQPVYKISDP